ncbi:MAG: polysaccharide deacetylase family protein [Ottowia sp.]|nr:polysaccharide deacetylase family protein [Ottowia sp.]
MRVLCGVLCGLWLVCGGMAQAAESAGCGAAVGGNEAAWAVTPADAHHALPNDRRPPQRREPATLLPPLPPEAVGLVRRVDTSERVLALTFDLCELATNTTGCDMDICNFLRREGIAATLFMGGKWMRTHARRVRQLLTVPYFEIANHAWSHGNCALLSPAGLRAQVLWTQAQYELLREEALREAGAGMHIPPVPTLFRLPYGRCTPQALRGIADMGLQVIQWDVTGESGADNRDPQRARAEARKLAAQTKPGSIILFHANLVPRGTAVLLRAYVEEMRARGYAFSTVSDLLRRGRPVRSQDGYFSRPGDNVQWDGRFGPSGTGERTPFTGE